MPVAPIPVKLVTTSLNSSIVLCKYPCLLCNGPSGTVTYSLDLVVGAGGGVVVVPVHTQQRQQRLLVGGNKPRLQFSLTPSAQHRRSTYSGDVENVTVNVPRLRNVVSQSPYLI